MKTATPAQNTFTIQYLLNLCPKFNNRSLTVLYVRSWVVFLHHDIFSGSHLNFNVLKENTDSCYVVKIFLRIVFWIKYAINLCHAGKLILTWLHSLLLCNAKKFLSFYFLRNKLVYEQLLNQKENSRQCFWIKTNQTKLTRQINNLIVKNQKLSPLVLQKA